MKINKIKLMLFISAWCFCGTQNVSGQVKINVYTFSNGAIRSANQIYTMTSNLGQPIIGRTDTNSNFRISSGILVKRKDAYQLPESWNFTANTNNSATVVLPTNSNPNIDGDPLQIGDLIGAFTPAGLCAGWAHWQGANLALTVWGDDNQTTEIDGFQSGEVVHFRVYRLPTQQEWQMITVNYSQGSDKYATDGFNVLASFDVADMANTRELTLQFNQGWNMVSINVSPDEANMDSIMTPIKNKINIVKNGAGDSYIPAFNINDIGEMDVLHGYQASLTEMTFLTIIGTPVDPSTLIPLQKGWNLIAYLPNAPLEPEIAFASIQDKLVIAKNGSGQSFIPKFSINDLGQLLSGQAYQLNVTEPVTLIYPSSANSSSFAFKSASKLTSETQAADVQHFVFTANTGENATVVVPASSSPRYEDGTTLQNGDEIGVFSDSGFCVGAVAWEGVNTAITVWGDDSQTDSTDGFVAGDTLRFRIWRQSEDKEYAAIVSFQSSEQQIYKANGLSILSDLIANDITTTIQNETDSPQPTEYLLTQNYPNPFNPETTIRFELPEAGETKLTIYNITGQVIRILVNEYRQAGRFEVSWNGKNDSGKNVPSGLYIYKLEAGKRITISKKMLLMQ